MLISTISDDHPPVAHTLTDSLADLPWAQHLGTPTPGRHRRTAAERAAAYLAAATDTAGEHSHAVSLPIGLGIGRLVFRALNAVEAVLAVALLIAIGSEPSTLITTSAVGVVVVTLAVQLLVVRPLLSRRSDAVLAVPSVSAAPSMSAASGGPLQALTRPLWLRRSGNW